MGRASITHTLVVPSETRQLAKVRNFVVKHARQANVGETHIEALRLAIDEACANVIEHAYQGNPEKEVSLAITIEPTRVVVQIRDHGRPFDRTTYQRPNVMELSRKRKSGGLGVDIIRRLMDEVQYLNHGDTNEIRFVRFRRAHRDGLR